MGSILSRLTHLQDPFTLHWKGAQLLYYLIAAGAMMGQYIYYDTAGGAVAGAILGMIPYGLTKFTKWGAPAWDSPILTEANYFSQALPVGLGTAMWWAIGQRLFPQREFLQLLLTGFGAIESFVLVALSPQERSTPEAPYKSKEFWFYSLVALIGYLILNGGGFGILSFFGGGY